MRKFIQKLLRNPVSKIAARYESRPERALVHQSLDQLYNSIIRNPGKKGCVIPFTDRDKFIILSDQHKGAKNGSDDFSFAEKNYLTALQHYNERNYTYINLGDSEELWENNILSVRKHNRESFAMEKLFLQRKAFYKIFGNHDLYWGNDPLASVMLSSIYGEKVNIYEGIVLQTSVGEQPINIFLTHGHQGDKQSDGNWFSKWFVSTIWAPLQMYLQINLNTPASDNTLKTEHNRIMYEWIASKKNMLLITGHTHQAVFVSLTNIERLYGKLLRARRQGDSTAVENLEAEIKLVTVKEKVKPDFSAYQPTYFNTGCCCYNDGDITGIELSDGYIRLVKWQYTDGTQSQRQVLEEIKLYQLVSNFASWRYASTDINTIVKR